MVQPLARRRQIPGPKSGDHFPTPQVQGPIFYNHQPGSIGSERD